MICKLFMSQKNRRLPLALFYAMINIARVNSFVLYKAASPNNKMKRRALNISIGQNLIFPHMRVRLQEPALHKELRLVIHRILNVPEDLRRTNDQERSLKRQRCAACPRKYDRKYSTILNNLSKQYVKLIQYNHLSVQLAKRCKCMLKNKAVVFCLLR